MKTACVILNYNDAETCLKLLKQIKSYTIFNHIVLVDNKSDDNSFQLLKAEVEGEKVVLLSTDKNGGYGYGNNVGVKYAAEVLNCAYVLIVNPDVTFSEQCIEDLLKILMNRPECGVISTVQLTSKGTRADFQCWDLPTTFDLIVGSGLLGRVLIRRLQNSCRDKALIRKTGAVSGSLLLISSESFLNCGGYDEEVFLYEEESILGYRMSACGYYTYFFEDQAYIHEHSVSISKSIPKETQKFSLLLDSRMIYLKKYLKASKVIIFFASVYYKILIMEFFLWKKIKSCVNKRSGKEKICV